MSENFKVLFLLKKGREVNPVSLPIYVRVTINGERAEWSVQRKCEVKKWNQKVGRASGTKEESKNLNCFLDVVQAQVFQIQRESALRNETVTADQVKSIILHKDSEKKHGLVEVYKYHNEQFEKLVGLEYSIGTFKKFNCALKSLEEFLKWKYSKKDILISQVNHEFITEYEFYLKSVQKLQHNSAMGIMKKLKKIIRQCVANDWLQKDPFKSYKITTRETHRNFLMRDELETLREKKIRVQRLDQVRDIFLFSCYTGLSYSDVMSLSPNDISIGIDGEQWIFTKRTKTETTTRVPLLPTARSIIEKYSTRADIINSERVLPKLTNQRLNSYLKELGDICGFKKELTFHCARHTFATTVTLSNGVPIETVGKMLGHKTLRTTQIYAKVLDNKVSQDMQHLKKKLMKAI
jgi:site-specific recombinase XerD